jgi:hypothetical protein
MNLELVARRKSHFAAVGNTLRRQRDIASPFGVNPSLARQACIVFNGSQHGMSRLNAII